MAIDKSFLLRLNESYKIIKTQLLLNETIRQLLFYDKIDDTTPIPTVEMVSDYIYLQPVVNIDVMEPFNKKSYITITMPESEKQTNKMNYIVRIIIQCETKVWDVNGDIRPLLISQEVINVLNGLKTKLANPLTFDSIVETVTNKDFVGYSLLFSVEDGVINNDAK